MRNKNIKFFRQQIGEELKNSPSPVSLWLKPVLTYVEEGEVHAEIKIRKEMTNPLKGIHGGMISLIMDDIIGATVFTLNTETMYISVDMHTDFLLTAKEGEILTAKATVYRHGKTIVNAESELINSRGKTIAKATSNLVATQIKKSHFLLPDND